MIRVEPDELVTASIFFGRRQRICGLPNPSDVAEFMVEAHVRTIRPGASYRILFGVWDTCQFGGIRRQARNQDRVFMPPALVFFTVGGE